MNWIKHKIKNLIITILGIALVLGWWTLRGPRNDPNHTIQETKIPEVFWEGGTHTLQIDATTTTDSTISVSLEGPKPGNNPNENRWQEAFEPMAPSTKTWTIHFPADTQFGTVELNAKNPKVGDKLKWTVKIDSKVIQQDEYVLDKPLEQNTAMFLQVSLDDFLSPDELPMDDSGDAGDQDGSQNTDQSDDPDGQSL